jgi:uncharacterized protein (DUF885 family)
MLERNLCWTRSTPIAACIAINLVMCGWLGSARAAGTDSAIYSGQSTIHAGQSLNDAGLANDKKFAILSDTFMKESLALSPTSASQAGYHHHLDSKSGKPIELDAVLDDLSSSAIAAQESFYTDWRNRFHSETPLQSLGKEDAADWQLIDDQIALELLELEKIKNYKHNPTVPVELIGNAIFQPLTEDYAPQEQRLRHILSRVEQIPRILSQVKAYLDNADPVFVTTAIEENAGNIDLIENSLSAEIPAGSGLKTEYDSVAPLAISALKDFSKWLEEDLGKRPSSRSWRLGKTLYDQKFKLVMEAELTPEQVLADAEKELESVRQEMLGLALPLYKEMYPAGSNYSGLTEHERANRIIGAVLAKISDNHCNRNDLQKTIEADLEGITNFIRDHHIVTLSSRNNLKVVPTPVFERGILSVAAFHNAPPLNPKAEAMYWVTPIESSMPGAKAESKLREYNNFTLKWLTIHEALPGHYIQFEHLNSLEPERRRLLRSLFGNGAYIEGWAEYIAQVMMDEGFMKDDPRFRMVMRKIRLRLLANAILDIKMHTMNMSEDEAMALMTKEAFQTQAEAEGKLKRAKLSSCQLPTYFVGLREWLLLRQKYQTKAGSDFNLCRFHDRALGEGPLPVPIVEKLILPAAGN